MMRLTGIGIYFCAAILFSGVGWAQPEFQRLHVLQDDVLPAVLYLEHRDDIGKQMLMYSYPEFGYWATQEICRAPYIDVVYSGKGGAIIAAGDSADNCYLYGVDLVNARIKQILDKPLKNPWLGKRHREWIRTEPQSSSIYMAIDQPDSPNLLIVSYSYALHTVEIKEAAKYLFGDEIKGDFHFRIAPDGKHVAYATKPKAVADKPGAFESTLKVLHFSNMSVTDATKSIVTYAGGGESEGWPAFDFQTPTLIHYFTMAPLATPSKTQVTLSYKAVEIEAGTNTEILSSIQPIPQNAGTLYRAPNSYYMLYEQFAPTAKRFLVDHDNTRSMLVFPETGNFSLSREADLATVKCDNEILYSSPNPADSLLGGVVSYFENRAFCLRSENPAAPGTQIWFHSPLGYLDAVAWTTNNITLVGILEIADPLKKKI